MSRLDYEQFELSNGLKVIVREDFTTSSVAVDVLYRVGARNEKPDHTGLAHLFEHLMFGGSKNIPEYDTPLQLVGGQNNAYTTNDITNYYLSLPANQIETAFWLESDRMLELEFSQKSLDVQKSVVCEEFKQRYLNQPYGDAYLLIRPVHYQKHPYQWATIGKELSHVEKTTLDDIKDFFYSFYAPNNATLVVVGAVKKAEVERLANKWFGPIPNRSLKKLSLTVEPKQLEARSLTVQKKVPYPAIIKCFHIPERLHPDYAAADLVTDVLGNGNNSILYQALVKEKQIASSVSVFSWGSYDPGMITIDARLSVGVSVEEYEFELQQALNQFVKVEDHDLQRYKNKYESVESFERISIMNQAQNLAIADSLGNPELANDMLKLYQDVSIQDLQRVFNEYVRKENCTTLNYLPE